MDRLGDAVDEERSRLFVGRRAELELLEKWLAMPEGPSRILFICGMGGIGKSALLAEMAHQARRHGALALWLDGAACGCSPAGFLDYLGTVLNALPGGSSPDRTDPLARLAAVVAGGGRVFLGVDNCEAILPLEGWLRENLFRRLPGHGVLAALASRQSPSPSWLADPAWRRRLQTLPLAPFTRVEAHQYLERLGLAGSETAEAVIRAAAGLPLALAVGAEQMARQPRPAEGEMAREIGARLVREAAVPGLHDLLDVLAVLPRADQELLAEVSGSPVTPDQYHTLARLSFVHSADDGLALHEVARWHLVADLRQRAPYRFGSLQRRALGALQARLSAARLRHQRRRLSTQLLSLCRNALPMHAWFADHTATPETLVLSSFRAEDRPALHRFMDHWGTSVLRMAELDEEHRLLDALCDRFPEAVWVLRSLRGEPLAFMGMILLCRETAALLEEYRMGRIYLHRCGVDERKALDCTMEEADTYYCVLGGYDDADRSYAVGELAGLMFFHSLTVLGEGVRYIGLTCNPEIREYVRRDGFRPRPECAATIAGCPWPWQVEELDLRAGGFGEWVGGFLQSLQEPLPGSSLSRNGTPGPVTAAGPVTVTALRQALSVIGSPRRLESSALAQQLGCTGHELRRLLVNLLTAPEAAPPLTAVDQEVLRAAFLRSGARPEGAAALLHLSRATYYRRLRTALDHLAEGLQDCSARLAAVAPAPPVGPAPPLS